jgi:1,4-dihydroxy-2-naphthoyl-CoA hydrolase
MSDAPHPSSLITPESVRNFLPGSFPGDLGIEPLEIEDSHSRGRIVVDERHLHPGGFVHGGFWTALGDTVAAWATFRNIPPGHNFTTIELKLNVFGPGKLGDELICEARPLHIGRSTAVIEARVLNGEKLVANLVVTQFVLPGRDPRAERPAPGDYPPGD